MIDILRELYNGEVYPAEQIETKDESFQAALQRYNDAKQEFRKVLNTAQQQQFDDLDNLENESGREYDMLNFRKGFQLGMQLTMAGLEKDRLDGLLKQE